VPVISCQKGGKSGFKYGRGGKCYTYTAGNERSRKAAIARAQKQGRAIAISKAREKGHVIPKK